MKRLFLLIVGILAAVSVSAQADSLTLEQIKVILRETPAKAGGNHLNYPVESYSPAPAPKGYEPVVISHYGRHGSRFATSSDKYDEMERLLREGHERAALTDSGEDLYRRYMDIYPLLKDHKGDLTVKGQEQHRGIARRMVAAYPKVFSRNVTIDARSTTVPRAIVSMMSFCDELRILRPKLTIRYGADTPDLSYTALRDPRFKDGEKFFRKYLKAAFANTALNDSYTAEYADGDMIAEAFFLRYFKDIETVNGIGNPKELFSTIGEVITSMQCMDFDADFSDILTEDEVFAVWNRGNFFAALMFIGTPYTNGLIPNTANTLLEQIMDSADKDLAGEGVQVRLRFGHDTVVAPLAALLGLPGWEELGPDARNWKYHFQSWNIPMATNIQFIFYRNKKSPQDVLVRVMYNEKDQVLPLPDQSIAPYYKWSDFKAYYKPVCENAAESVSITISAPIFK